MALQSSVWPSELRGGAGRKDRPVGEYLPQDWVTLRDCVAVYLVSKGVGEHWKALSGGVRDECSSLSHLRDEPKHQIVPGCLCEVADLLPVRRWHRAVSGAAAARAERFAALPARLGAEGGGLRGVHVVVETVLVGACPTREPTLTLEVLNWTTLTAQHRCQQLRLGRLTELLNSPSLGYWFEWPSLPVERQAYQSQGLLTLHKR